MHLFERPCIPGWIYPCSLEDITLRMAQFPSDDIEGLWAIGLVPATRKDCHANARYFATGKPVVHIYSYPESLRFRLPAYTKPASIELGLRVEYEYDMKIEQEGKRYVCVWASSDLRRFVVEHVLAHEIGHHVYHQTRKKQEYVFRPHTTASEQFAEAYALRCSRR